MSLFDLHLKSKSEPYCTVRFIRGKNDIREVCIYIYIPSIFVTLFLIFLLFCFCFNGLNACESKRKPLSITCTVSTCIIIQCKQLDNYHLAFDPQVTGSAIRLCYRCSRPGDQQSISIIFSLPLQITKEGSTQKSQAGIDALSAVSYGWSMSVAVPYSLISRLLDSHSSKPQNNG